MCAGCCVFPFVDYENCFPLTGNPLSTPVVSREKVTEQRNISILPEPVTRHCARLNHVASFHWFQTWALKSLAFQMAKNWPVKKCVPLLRGSSNRTTVWPSTGCEHHQKVSVHTIRKCTEVKLGHMSPSRTFCCVSKFQTLVSVSLSLSLSHQVQNLVELLETTKRHRFPICP